MGLQASIDLKFTKKTYFNDLLIQLYENGWVCNDNGNVFYLDNDDYDWKNGLLAQQQEIIDLLNKRNRVNKIIGVCLIHKSLVGGQFLFYTDNKSLSIILNVNRVKIQGLVFTDYTHYIKLLQPILKNSYYIQCEDCI